MYCVASNSYPHTWHFLILQTGSLTAGFFTFCTRHHHPLRLPDHHRNVAITKQIVPPPHKKPTQKVVQLTSSIIITFFFAEFSYIQKHHCPQSKKHDHHKTNNADQHDCQTAHWPITLSSVGLPVSSLHSFVMRSCSFALISF